MTLRASLAALALVLAVASAAQSQVTDEIAVSQPVYGHAPSDQYAPVIATDGVNFLAAWIDGRSIPGSIYASRVDRDGHVLDGTGIRIPTEPTGANGRLIGVFFVDGAYTIVYSYQTFDPAVYHAAAAIVSVDGRLIAEPHTVIDDDYVRTGATNGSKIVLIAGNHSIVLNGRGQEVDRFTLPGGGPYGMTIASNGSTFLVGTFAYNGVSNSVNLIALDPNGKPAEITTIAASASGDGPIMASDGVDYLVLYRDLRTFNPIAQYVDAHAAIRSTTVLPGADSLVAGDALVWTGNNYLAAVVTGLFASQDIQLLAVKREGTSTAILRSVGAGTPGTVNTPALSWNGKTALIAWTSGSQDALNGWEVVGALTTADGAAASPVFTIPESSNIQVAPAIATSGNQDLAVWIEPTGVYATRITAEGRMLDGRGITVSSQTFPSRALSLDASATVRAVYDGSSYLVAWGDYSGVTAQRIDPATGSLIGASIVLAPCTRSFDLAMDAESPVLFNAPCSDSRIFAQRIGNAGSLGQAVPISPDGMYANWARAAWNGSEWLVVWSKLVPLPLLVSPPIYRSAGVYAARLSNALTLRDVQPIQIVDSDVTDGWAVVGTDGTEFLVAWWHLEYNTSEALYLRHVTSEGSLSDPERIADGTFVPQSIVWTGGRYTMAYARSDAYWNYDLFLTHVSSRTGAARDQVQISVTPLDERSISLVAPAGRPVRAVYTRVAPEPQYGGVSRVFMRDEVSSVRRRSVPRR